ncbi:hypothetical protein ON010_g12546 [Phytophthora cinnamomi]|nr:hypothetical protein ON010_g12546 [Phytophthora cinnamomi]
MAATSMNSDSGASSCYEAFITRRRARGELSVRTLEGFQRLQKRYGQLGTTGASIGNLQTGPVKSNKTPEDCEVDAAKVRDVADVFFSPKISRVITETCWSLAHFGGGDDTKDQKWVFPELPRKEAQQLVQSDWEHDLKFDELQGAGLSLYGFKLSLVDLATSCTDGTASKCLVFLNLMARWLQQSLPPYPKREIPQVVRDLVEATKTISSESKCPKAVPAPIVWQPIPLSMMAPCQIGSGGLYCELKAKVCSAPMAIMILADDKKWVICHASCYLDFKNPTARELTFLLLCDSPIELLLSTNSKQLITKSGTRVGAYRKVTTTNALCGELKRRGFWTFHLNPSTPLILMVPNESISRQTKTIYAYFRAFDTEKQSDQPQLDLDGGKRSNKPSPTSSSSSVTLFTSTPEHCWVRFGSNNNVPFRMERMSARMFSVDHSVMQGGSFSVIVTASLLQCTSSAGGPGAAAAVSSTFEKESTFIVKEDQWTRPGGDQTHIDAHTFIFIFKSTESVVPRKTGMKEHEATLPQQWFTSLSAANEIKTIVIEQGSTSISKNSAAKIEKTRSDESQRREAYHVFIFTLHGIYVEVSGSAAPIERNGSDSCDSDSSESEGSDSDDRVLSMISHTPLTSAELLKELLFLQKMRRNQSTLEDPPEIVIGTQVTTTKTVTIAESLRIKVLRSRQDERHDRFVELETAIRVDCKERPSHSTSAKALDISDEKQDTLPSSSSELEKRISLMTTFFHEMAVHQPKLDELHGSAAEVAEAAAEEQLLKRFGDMFNCDENLQNAVDEEKWSTDTAKVARRRSSISTNLPRAMQAEEISGTRDQIDEGKCPWTFEDYENTAQYIEQLMIDIDNHATQQQALQDTAEADRKQAVMAQLVASWQYTQHRVNKAATIQRVREIEQKRRSQWLQSQHVQAYGVVASARRADRPERPAFVLPKQRFLVQEESLPSTAIWEVPGSPSSQSNTLLSGAIAVAGLVSPSKPLSPRGDGDAPPPNKIILPRRPPQRPMTVATLERPTNITALRSAALSRARVRRIRSAHSSSRGESSPPPRQTALPPKKFQQSELEMTPQQGISLPLENIASPSTIAPKSQNEDDSQLHAIPNTRTRAKSLNSVDAGRSALMEIRPAIPTLPDDQETRGNLVATDTPNIPTQPEARRKRLKKKRLSLSIARFRRRVQELVSISAQLQSVALDEWKQAQGIESIAELRSVPCLPTRPTKPASNT